ncbi:MAG TPA: glycosyltransferase [Anaerolineales bacterium]|nr:glycosyltransferase [Anaerolineales bacterium]
MNRHRAWPAVSVVIGCYNAAPWIRETIDSVLAQTHPVLEVLVVDDGSTDGTSEIVASYPRGVRFLAEKHRGRPYRNQGIMASRGDLIAFVDADDLWHAEKIERQLQALYRTKAEWAICGSQWLHADTGLLTLPPGAPPREGYILEPLFLGNFIVASSTVVSRRALESAGYFDESPDVAPVEDWDLWLRIAADFPVACVPEPLVTLRLHESSFLAGTPMQVRIASLETVVDRAARREAVRLGPLRKKALFGVYYAAGVADFRRGRLPAARIWFLRAWRQAPANLASLAYVSLTYLNAGTTAALLRVKRRLSKSKFERSVRKLLGSDRQKTDPTP